MGMSASQARLLFISSRMHDIEMKSQNIANQKIRLASDSEQVSANYVKALNKTNLIVTDPLTQNTQQLAYNTIMSPDAMLKSYSLRDVKNRVVVSNDVANAFRNANGSLDKFLENLSVNTYSTPQVTLSPKMTLPILTNQIFTETPRTTPQALFTIPNVKTPDLAASTVFNTSKISISDLMSQLGTGPSLSTTSTVAISEKTISEEKESNFSIEASTIAEPTATLGKANINTIRRSAARSAGDSDGSEENYDIDEELSVNTTEGSSSASGAGDTGSVSDVAVNNDVDTDDYSDDYSDVDSDGDVAAAPVRRAAAKPTIQTVDDNNNDIGIIGNSNLGLTTLTDRVSNNNSLAELGDFALPLTTDFRTTNSLTITQTIEPKFSIDKSTILGSSFVSITQPVFTRTPTDTTFTTGIKIFTEGVRTLNTTSTTPSIDPDIWNEISFDFGSKTPSDITPIDTGEVIETYSDPETDYYTNLFNQMKTDGYVGYDQKLLDSKEALANMLQNGEWFLSKVDEQGKYSKTSLSSNSLINEVSDKDAIAKAEAEYNAETLKINNKEKRLDNELKKLDTEHSALNTEYDSVQNLIKNNTEKNFNLFS